MKNIVITSLISSAVLISACSSTPMWRKLGVKPIDTQNEIAKCRYEVGLAKIPQNEKASLIKDCMYAKGFKFSS